MCDGPPVRRTNVVSILGTAMTEQHVGILRRFADKIVLLFDADTAGDTAVDRTVELFLTQPVEIAIASMPEGVDPDE
jgi:DNA primase